MGEEEMPAPVPVQEEELPAPEEEVPVQEVELTGQGLVLEEPALNLTSQEVESFIQGEDERGAAMEKNDQLQETVEGLSVSVKELWSCVTDLVAKADESAELAKQKQESECTAVTAEYVQKYSRQYAKQYTRQYVQAYRNLLQEEMAKNTDERKASVEACDVANETTSIDDILLQPAENCDAAGVLLELPAFRTELTTFKTP